MLTITLIRSGISLTWIRYCDLEIFLLYKQNYSKTWYTIPTIVFNIFIEIMLATKRRCSQSFLNFLSDLSYSPFHFLMSTWNPTIKKLIFFKFLLCIRERMVVDTGYLHSLIISSLQHAYRFTQFLLQTGVFRALE